MDIEELQTALDNAQSNDLYIPLPILDAARMWLNPNIEAAAKAVSIYVHGYSPLSPDQMRLLEKQLRVGVAAALTPPGVAHLDGIAHTTGYPPGETDGH